MNHLNNNCPGGEPSKSHARRVTQGFYDKYLSGSNILDVGGGMGPAITPCAKIIDIGYPGYDGLSLPFENASQDAVFSSHCLEHVDDPVATLKEWFRVVRVGGFIVLTVPHHYLYERKNCLPSRWNADHKRFYTPASLLADVEMALEHNTYRVRSLLDNDAGFDYVINNLEHAVGCYEIELVIEKIAERSLIDINFTSLIEKIKSNTTDGGLAICGAGDIGVEVLTSLKNAGVNVDVICDKSKRCLQYQNISLDVKSLEDAMSLGCNKFIIASRAFKFDIQADIERLHGDSDGLYLYFVD